MHALNNAIGEPLHDANDMAHACDVYVRETLHEGFVESRALHERVGGWYSSEVMAKAVTTTCMRKRGRVQHIMKLEPLHANPGALRACLGAVVNLENIHWVALRWHGDRVWLLDSQAPSPILLSWDQYLGYISCHRDAYRIEIAPEAATAG